MNDATCITCPWWAEDSFGWRNKPGDMGECRFSAPIMDGWTRTEMGDWCGSHPDRQPHLECATTTIVGRETLPTESDMRRIVDALEKMASRAQRATA